MLVMIMCYIDRFTVEDLQEAMKNVKCGKTCGLDGMYWGTSKICKR